MVPTKAIVNGFGEISEDNKKIIMMESIAEGITPCFLGVLVILVTTFGNPETQTASIVYYSVITMLLVMALLTALTGARTSIIPYKICPIVKTLVAILIVFGIAI